MLRLTNVPKPLLLPGASHHPAWHLSPYGRGRFWRWQPQESTRGVFCNRTQILPSISP